jgi:glycerol uptake facilitator protein
MGMYITACIGEFLGTFLLVFFGTSIVAVAVLFNAPAGLVQVAAVWGIGVTLSIYATRHLSCAHLNPAVSLAMVCAGRMNLSLLPFYWISQLSGAVFAGLAVLLLFHGSISSYEVAHAISRGTPASVKTAMLFGEYFPNPGFSDLRWFDLTLSSAMCTEGFGTFVLVTMIFLLTEGCNLGGPGEKSAPLFIGMTVSLLISITAPLTQTGINPARDFGPRLIAYFSGWGPVAIPGPRGGFFLVYILSPLLGGASAAVVFRFLLARLMLSRNVSSSEEGAPCGCRPGKE